MKTRQLCTLVSAIFLATSLAATAWAGPPKMKMTTEIPESIKIPDKVETRFGTLRFEDGFPTEETAQKIYDQLDFQRAVESVILTTPGGSLAGFRTGIREYGPDNETAIIWEERMDSKVQLLTPNCTVVYVFLWLNLKGGPMVMESPPNVLGLVDDFWFRYVADFGLAGPDKGKGGKYLFLPPGYKGEVPAGYHVAQSETYGHWLLIRGFLKDGDPKPGVKNIKDNFKLYPLGKTASASKVKYHDISMKYLNTIHASDENYFEEINEIVQEEPTEAQSPEILGLLRSIGIEKGKPFAPDARMKKILKEAAYVGSAAQRVLLYSNRDAEAKVYPNSGWEHPWIGGSHEFLSNGARLIDARCRFHMYATGITPAMVTPKVGKGSQYVAGMRDSKGNRLEGKNTYKVHLPPNVPANQFWSFTVYDVQTRSMLQTDQRFPEITSADASTQQNADGSYDVYFGPEAPAGKESNWVQTVPGKGWHMLFRLYGPEQAWFDKTWRPSEIELVE
jgi:hypothetical protein